MIRGDTISEGVRPTGVFGHVAADGAGALARRIGRVIILFRLHGESDIEIDHAGLYHGALIIEVNLKDPVHSRETDGDASGARNCPAAQACPRSSSHDLDPV